MEVSCSEMKNIIIKEPGGPEVLTLVEAGMPAPGPGQVLIKVSAAGVNRPDVMQRLGKYPPPPGASDIPGLELSGEVIETNGDFAFPQAGDKVCALVHSGGYADYAVADASLCLPVPDGLAVDDAAALPETVFTVWNNVFDRCGLKKGESLLIHGGSSGIGTIGIQMGRAMGATVFVTAGSAEKCRICEQLGARLAINYNEQDFVEKITEAQDGAGVDVILDMVAGDYVRKDITLAAPDGRIAIISGLKGWQAEIDCRAVMVKRLTLTGSTLRPMPARYKAAIARNLEQHIWPFISSGQIKPIIYKKLPLAQAADAHAIMESSAHIGKILLIPNGAPRG